MTDCGIVPRRCGAGLCAAVTVTLAVAFAAAAAETPTSSGPVANLDTPVLRVPFMPRPPKIDGAMDDKEWEDASALSGFWYDFHSADFRFLAPYETQLQVYMGYDKDNLYIAYRSPVYPEASWLKANGRFPDVHHHPAYGLIWDDHIELELRPYAELTRGYKLGLFKWFVNPTGVIADQNWSLNGGDGDQWKSNATVRCNVTDKLWTIEMAVPLAAMKYFNYAGKEEDGRDIVSLPPGDGMALRCWFTRAIGGTGTFFNAFDKHVWNTTKTMLVLDSKAVGIQVNDIGRVMEDRIEAKVTLKNHSTESQTVRLGFFVESAEGGIYSSYDDPSTKEGMVELVPGEVREVPLTKSFPGISKQGNSLWFDVRSAGTPAKVLFQTRLIDFHSQDLPGFRERRVDPIAKLRPPKRDFDFTYVYSPYKNRISALVDRGINGASEDAQRATEAVLTVLEASEEEKEIAKVAVPFKGAFANFLIDLPGLKTGSYKVSLLMFDQNKRIVGERNPDPFYKGAFEWEHNKLGLDDVVWVPFTPIVASGNALETLKHKFTVDASGLPAQIYIKPDPRDVPLEKQAAAATLTDAQLVPLGRGNQLRSPLRLEAIIGGKRLPATVTQNAKLKRQWKSELEYDSKLKAGPIEVDLTTQYDCDGTMQVTMTYGGAEAAEIDGLELVMDVAGPVDMAMGEQGSGMTPQGRWELTLPQGKGVVWDSAKDMQRGELYYSQFVPFFLFGNGDRAFMWVCDSEQPWYIDREGSTMTLERDDKGQVSWHVKIVNHKSVVAGKRTTVFQIVTYPDRPKPADHRKLAWFHGSFWDGDDSGNPNPNDGPGGIDGSDVAMELFRKHYPGRPLRLYINDWTNVGTPALQKNAYNGEWFGDHSKVDSTPMDSTGKYGQPWTRPGKAARRLDHGWSMADFFVFHLERQIRLARSQGWWWDEQFAPFRTNNVASGNAFWREPNDIGPNELPYQSNFATIPMRQMFKRLARCFAANNVPNRTYIWANDEATAFAPYAWDTQLIEGACAYISSREIDNITSYPLSCFRYMAHNYTGLVARVTGNQGRDYTSTAGDEVRIDRGIIGRALIHDIGVSAERVVHHGVLNRVMNVLKEFGYYEEAGTEVIPYWRSDAVVKTSVAKAAMATKAATTQPATQPTTRPAAAGSEVYVTVYRRATDKGAKAMIIIQNENDYDIRCTLQVTDPAAVFGGPNSLTAQQVNAAATLPDAAKDLIGGGSAAALRDMETGGAIGRKAGATDETYGPIFVPMHDFRIIYGQCAK